LPVGSDVLDGGSSDGAGDAGEALDAGVAGGEGVVDEGVPDFASSYFEDAVGEGFYAGDLHLEDEAGEAGVGDEEVAAAAEEEEWEGVFGGVGDGFGDVGFSGGFGEETGWAAYLEGGEGG